MPFDLPEKKGIKGKFTFCLLRVGGGGPGEVVVDIINCIAVVTFQTATYCSHPCHIVGKLEFAMRTAFDTTALESERDELQNEMLETSELMQNSIYENAHIALDQTEYQKRYDALAARFDKAKARLETVEDAIKDKQSRQAAIEAYLETLKAQDALVERFDPALWCALLDFVTVYSKEDVRFTFKDGTEIMA